MKQVYSHPTQIPRSKTIRSIEWLSDRIKIGDPNGLGDTHPLTWAADDEIYVGTGDPQALHDSSGERFTTRRYALKYDAKNDPEVDRHLLSCVTGSCVEKFSGDPENMTVSRVNDLPWSIGWGGSGAKPTGMISVDGVLYLALQNTLGWKPPHFGSHCQHGSDATIICSRDFGKTWEPDLSKTMTDFYNEHFIRNKAIYSSPSAGPTHFAVRDGEWTPYYERMNYKDYTPMFPGDWFGTPAFVQYGKDNADAVDGYVYAVSSDQFDNGTNLRVGRVPKEKIMDREAWEFATYLEDGSVGWTHDLFESDPMLEIYRHIGAPEMVYIPSIKKYLLLTWAHHTDFDPRDGSELTVLEADNPWGPYSLVFYEWMWYKQESGGYCPRIPMKWFDNDELTGYLEWAGNYMNIWAEDTYYCPNLRKFKLILASKK